jgi:predicted ATPase
LVDLAALNSPAMVAGAVATAVRAPLGPGDEPLDGLVEALKSRALLIVLDNAEHLVDAAARVVQRLLEATARVAFVVTSQVPLRIAGEQVYRLGTLRLPQAGCAAAEALACSAVALFAERATASARGLAFGDAEVAQIAAICRHLDGLPLAIELAAARAALLGLPALVRNIDQRFRMLGSGERTAPVRQQTLRAAFDWSYDLLASDAQIVFRRLGVFSGSFTLEAAQEVVADARIDSWSVVEHLAELIDRSMVAVDDHADARYRLLETARAFALDRLREAGELDTVQHSHGRAMARRADQCFEDFWDLGDAELLGRYVPDLDNLRAALHRAGNEPEIFGRLAAGLLLLLRRLSLTREASALSQDAIALPPQALQAATLARLWQSIAFITYWRDAALRAIDQFRQLGDERGVYLALYPLVHQIHPTNEEMAAAAQESRRLRSADWSAKRQAIGVATEGWAARQCGDPAQASRLFAEAIGLCDAAGADDFGTAFRMQQFGVTIRAGDLDAAGEQIEQVLTRCRTLKNAYRLTCTQASLVNVRLAQGRLDSARAVATEFASFDRTLGWPHVCEIADALSLLAALCDRFEDAARLAGFADRVNKERGSDARDDASEMSRQRVGRILQQRVAADRLPMLKEQGGSLDIDRAVALALQAEPT